MYETPELLLVGLANSLVHGGGLVEIDRLPESDLRKGSDIPEGLDE